MPVQKVAVIGAGPAGRAFALRCAAAGLDVVLEDVMPSNLRRARDERRTQDECRARDKDGEMAVGNSAGSLRYALTVEDAVRDADVAIDFVPDELESKLEIFSMLDRMAPPRTILCTPTSTLSITDLASCTYRSERCFALRGGVEDLLGCPLEIVRSQFSDEAALSAVADLFAHLGVHLRVIDDAAEPMLVKNLNSRA